MSLNELPLEIIDLIIQRIDRKDLFHSRKVNRILKESKK